MLLPPVAIMAGLYDIANIRTFLLTVKEKESAEAAKYGRENEVKNILESLGIDMANADRHDFVTRMKIKMIGDI